LGEFWVELFESLDEPFEFFEDSPEEFDESFDPFDEFDPFEFWPEAYPAAGLAHRSALASRPTKERRDIVAPLRQIAAIA
jgi:hypothetical protein